MSGIFISYASEDREKAEMLAHALEQKGWPVWWDRLIPFGKSFDEVIEENLARAGCVLVLWTKVSVESTWVRYEASEAAAREVLIPVLFEPDVKIPLEFRLLQAVNLCDWRATAEHREFDALVAQIADRLKSAGSADAQHAVERTMSASLSRPKVGRRVAGVIVGIAAGVIAGVKGVFSRARSVRQKASPSPRSGHLCDARKHWLDPNWKRCPYCEGEKTAYARPATSIGTPLSGPAPVEPIFLGVTAPPACRPGDQFNPVLATYAESVRASTQAKLERLGGKGAVPLLDLAPDRQVGWKIGAPITVRVTVTHADVDPAQRTFEWNGRENLAAFTVRVHQDAQGLCD